MKKELATTVSTVLVAGQIMSLHQDLHIHAELCVQNIASDPTIDTSGSRFYRYWVHGGSLSARFSTREDAIRDAKSHGHSDLIIEIVNQDGMSVSQTLMDCPYPDLLYSGIRS
jgi:hypothetical protein